MAMASKHPKLRYKRPMSSPRGDGGCSSDFLWVHRFPPRLVQEERPKAKMAAMSYYVRVNDTMFKVPETFFLQMPPVVRETIEFSLGNGLTRESPIVLEGHSNDQFKQILSAHNAYPSLDVRSLTLDHFLTIGELSLHYQLKDLVAWFLPAFKATVSSHDTPLRTASGPVYVRMLKLAMAYRHAEIGASIQTKWITRMYWGELRPVTALLFADLVGLRDLLAHACYVYLMTVAQQIQGKTSITSELQTPTLAFDDLSMSMLSQRQRTHILAGYCSLRTSWRHLRERPPEGTPDPQCVSHTLCAKAWKVRWTALLDRPCPLPEVDVLGRLRFMERGLEDDGLLTELMRPECKTKALAAVSRKRNGMSRQLHHHFDLG